MQVTNIILSFFHFFRHDFHFLKLLFRESGKIPVPNKEHLALQVSKLFVDIPTDFDNGFYGHATERKIHSREKTRTGTHAKGKQHALISQIKCFVKIIATIFPVLVPVITALIGSGFKDIAHDIQFPQGLLVGSIVL